MRKSHIRFSKARGALGYLEVEEAEERKGGKWGGGASVDEQRESEEGRE